MAEMRVLVERAWVLSDLDPASSCELGRRIAAAGGESAAWGWLHVALAQSRIGDVTAANDALVQATAAFAADRQTDGLAMCDEVQAMILLRSGDAETAAAMQDKVDAAAAELPAMHRYLAHLSRAATARRLGRADEALRHGHAATDAAKATGWAGPRIVALAALGDCYWQLHQLEDARQLAEQALRLARDAGAASWIGELSARLVMIGYAAGQTTQSREIADVVRSQVGSGAAGTRHRLTLAVALGHLAVGEFAAAEALLDADADDADAATAVLRAWISTRCLLARGDADAAVALADAALRRNARGELRESVFTLLELCRAAADAAEAAGDPALALKHMRSVLELQQALAARSAKVRWLSLQSSKQLVQAQRERDMALDSRRSAEDDRRRLAELNAALREQIAQTEMLHAQLREQALRDPLTGLHNRRYLFEVAPGLLELARRQSTQLCVVLIDLDHFKLLNDTYGHQAGDLVLQRFAALLTQMLRRSDVVCRHGGEEFVAVMPDISADGAEQMLGRLLEAFQSHRAEIGQRRLPHGSFSAGIARFPRHGHTLEQLLSRADRALYAAKNQGRARIEQAPKTGFGTLI